MLRTIIIDDEQPVRQMLETAVNNYCDKVKLVGSADSVKTGLELIRHEKPDLVLLDINLPDGTGFDLLEKLGKNTPLVIFITAYNEFAIKAFRISAIDYILKPINIDNLIEAIEKASDSFAYKSLSIKLQNLFDNMNSQPGDKKIVLKTQESIHIVKVSDIIRCQSDHNYTEFYLIDGRKLLVSKTLKDFETMLESYGFFRTHQSHLINLNYIARFDKVDGGELVLADQSRVPVSVRKRDELFELFNQM